MQAITSPAVDPDFEVPEHVLPVWTMLKKASITRGKIEEKMSYFQKLEKVAAELDVAMFEENHKEVFKTDIHDRLWAESDLVPETETPNIPKIFKEELEVKWLLLDRKCREHKQELTILYRDDPSGLEKSLQLIETLVAEAKYHTKLDYIKKAKGHLEICGPKNM